MLDVVNLVTIASVDAQNRAGEVGRSTGESDGVVRNISWATYQPDLQGTVGG